MWSRREVGERGDYPTLQRVDALTKLRPTATLQTRPVGLRDWGDLKNTIGKIPTSISSVSASIPRSSPNEWSGASSPSRRYQPASQLSNRDYILGLANPESGTTDGPESGSASRVQKHPATFQCNLCPSRFTRAYNLRSHLRTHTNERPFVCNVCGKAFAHQIDRKRHEGLHSGEKNFVCKGELRQGGQWGCGRRFARADALGRHFRSEAGRICIKPLHDEEGGNLDRIATSSEPLWTTEGVSSLGDTSEMVSPPYDISLPPFPVSSSPTGNGHMDSR